MILSNSRVEPSFLTFIGDKYVAAGLENWLAVWPLSLILKSASGSSCLFYRGRILQFGRQVVIRDAIARQNEMWVVTTQSVIVVDQSSLHEIQWQRECFNPKVRQKIKNQIKASELGLEDQDTIARATALDQCLLVLGQSGNLVAYLYQSGQSSVICSLLTGSQNPVRLVGLREARLEPTPNQMCLLYGNVEGQLQAVDLVLRTTTSLMSESLKLGSVRDISCGKSQFAVVHDYSVTKWNYKFQITAVLLPGLLPNACLMTKFELLVCGESQNLSVFEPDNKERLQVSLFLRGGVRMARGPNGLIGVVGRSGVDIIWSGRRFCSLIIDSIGVIQ